MPLPLLPLAIGGLSALGGLFGNRPQTYTQSGQQQGWQENITRPVLPAEWTGMFYPVSDAYLKNLGQDTDLSGYEAGQTSSINDLSEIKKRALAENMAQRGITGNAAGNAETNVENQRFSDITKLHQQIPLLAQQLFQSKIQQGIDLTRLVPTGTTSWGQGSQINQSQTNQPGNMLGGLFGNLGTTLAGLYGAGAFGKP